MALSSLNGSLPHGAAVVWRPGRGTRGGLQVLTRRGVAFVGSPVTDCSEVGAANCGPDPTPGYV